MNNILVIKLTDDWLINEQIKNSLQKSLEVWGGAVLEDAIKDIHFTRMISNDVIYSEEQRDELYKFIEEKIAVEIGRYAMENGLIKFTEKQVRFGVEISGELDVLSFMRGDSDV